MGNPFYVASSRSSYRFAVAEILKADPQARIAYIKNLPNILHVWTSKLDTETLNTLPGVAHAAPMELHSKPIKEYMLS